MDFRLGVVTVWYGGAENIDRFVSNMKKIVKPFFLHVHVINYLEEQAEHTLRTASPEAIFINAGSNVGTAAAWNRAIEFLRLKGVTVVGIWNPDMELAENCLYMMAGCLCSEKMIGAVGPLICFSRDKSVVQFYGGSINVETGEAKHDYRGARDSMSLPASRDAGYLDGGAMMLKMDAIADAGMFDEKLFLYGEDSDFCMRLQKAGYRTVVVRDALAWHYHDEHRNGKEPTFVVFYLTRNMYYLAKKHGARSAWMRLLFFSLWQIPRRSLSYIYHREYHQLIPLWTGGICGILGIMGKRGWVK